MPRSAVEAIMKPLVGGLVAVVLLGLYVYSVVFAIRVVNCLSAEGCSHLTRDSFTSGFAATMSTVAGLVSALVISELAITNPGDTPARRILGPDAELRDITILTIVVILYLVAWVATGVAAYVVGAMWYPGTLQPLTDLGQAWLGLAVAAAYAYFGIRPEPPPDA